MWKIKGVITHYPSKQKYWFVKIIAVPADWRNGERHRHRFKRFGLSRLQSSRPRRAKRLSGGGGQSLKFSTKAAVFNRESLLIGGGGGEHVDWGEPSPPAPWRRPWVWDSFFGPVKSDAVSSTASQRWAISSEPCKCPGAKDTATR